MNNIINFYVKTCFLGLLMWLTYTPNMLAQKIEYQSDFLLIKPISKEIPPINWVNKQPIVSQASTMVQLEIGETCTMQTVTLSVNGAVAYEYLNKNNGKTDVGFNTTPLNNNEHANEDLAAKSSGTVIGFTNKPNTWSWRGVVPLEAGNNVIEVAALNQCDIANSQIFNVRYEPKTTMHLVLVAVSDYAINNSSNPNANSASAASIKDLSFPVSDAQLLQQIITQQTNGLFDNVEPYIFFNEAANKNNLEYLFDYQLPKALSPNDRIVFYFTGHGDLLMYEKDALDRRYFRLMLHDYDPSSELSKSSTSISGQYIEQKIENLTEADDCQALLIFDACNSAAAVEDSEIDAINISPNGRVAKIAASASKAYEHSSWQHSALTKALSEAFAGEIDATFAPNDVPLNNKLQSTKAMMQQIQAQGYLSVNMLLDYTKIRTNEIVKRTNNREEQKPYIQKLSREDDFPIFQISSK